MAAVLHGLAATRHCKIHSNGALISVSTEKMLAHWINKNFAAIVVIFGGREGFVLPPFIPKPSLHGSCLAWPCSHKVLETGLK